MFGQMNGDGIVETMSLQDVFIDCIAKAERVGPCTRLYLTVSVGTGRDARWEVQSRLMVPTDQIALMGLYLLNLAKAETPAAGPFVAAEVCQ